MWDAVDTSIWSATSGGATGASVPGPGDDVIMDGNSGGGTVTLGYSPTVNSITMGAFTGTFDGGGYSPTMATLSVSGTGARTLTMGAGTWTLTGNAATIFNMSVTTNLTFNKGNAFVCNYSGSTGTRTINNGTSSLHYPDFNITAGSDTVVITASTTLGGLNFTGFTGTWTNNSFSMSGNLTLGAGMTVGTGTGTLTGIGQPTGGNSFTITTNGKTIDFPINLTSLGGFSATWTLQDAFTLGSTRTLTLTAGTLDTNGQTCSWGLFSSSNSNTRVLTLGASTISLTATGTIVPWTCQTSTNMTLNAGTSTLSFATSSQSPTMQGGGLTYYNLSITSTSGGFTLGQSNTFNDITFAQGGGNRSFTLGTSTTQTINGLLTLTGFNASQSRLRVQSNTFGTQCTFALGATGTVAITNVDFSDIAFTGTNAPVSGTSLGDVGGNSGITFDAARTVYWVNGTGNMSSTSNWSLTSGGASGTDVPLCQDTLIFDANSFSAPGQTVTQDVFRCGSVNFSAVTNSPTWSFADSSSAGLLIVGSLTLSPSMSVTCASATGADVLITLTSRTSQTWTNAGITWGTGFIFTVNAPGGTYTLQDNFVMSDATRTFTVTQGTFDANGFNVTCGLFNSSNSNTRTLTMGSGTWTLTGVGTVWNFTTTTGLTYNVNTSTVVVSDTSSAAKTLVAPPGTAFYNVILTAGGTGPIAFSGTTARSLTNLTVTGPKTVQWTAAGSWTLANAPTITSSLTQPVTFLSSTPGTQYTLSVASGTVGSRFMSIFDCIGTGGATFVARESYGNNTTGWTIVPPRINQAMATESYALNFPNNAAVDVVSASNSGVAANGSWSLCAWIDITGYTGTRQDIHGVNFTPTNSAISVGSTGLYTLNDPIGLVATTVRAPIGRMVPVVTTWDATNARGSMYFDGYLIYTRTGTATAFTDGKIVTGRFAFSAAQPAWAAVSRRRVFARALSAEEVMAWSRNNVEPDDTGLRAEYNLLAGSGPTDVDSSGNGNNGTITGATWVTDRVYTARVAAANRVPTSGRNAATNRVQL